MLEADARCMSLASPSETRSVCAVAAIVKQFIMRLIMRVLLKMRMMGLLSP